MACKAALQRGHFILLVACIVNIMESFYPLEGFPLKIKNATVQEMLNSNLFESMAVRV